MRTTTTVEPASIALLLLLLLTACGGSDSTGMGTGALRVVVSTSGQDKDATGYVVTVGEDSRSVGLDETVSFDGLEPGNQSVLIEDIAPNCSPYATSESVTIEAGATTDLDFDVECVTKRQVVFWRWLGAKRDVFVMYTDGTGLTNLTNDDAPELAPAWSPDGTKIAFVSAFVDGADLWVMGADGSNPTPLVQDDGEDNYPTWSPDGTKIAFSRGAPGQPFHIWVVDADGQNLAPLTSGDGVYDVEPAWSPDGSTIAFSRDGDLWRMNADGSNPTLLTQNGNAPAWSPDGAKIAFDSFRSGLRADVYVMNADGTDVRRLTTDPADDVHPAWSPDGTRIGFESYTGGVDASLYLMKPDGSGVVLLADGAAGESHQMDWKK